VDNLLITPLCTNAIDLPPIWPLTICPIMAPSIAPDHSANRHQYLPAGAGL
jgi:hypothetical protein